MPQFKQMPQDPSQLLMFQTSVDDAVPADSEVRILNEVISELDWSGIESSYSENGCPAYPPRVMTKILVYAYSNGVRSSRKIEALVENDKRYMWLAGGLSPDFHTIARFRREKWDHLAGLFEDSARLCGGLGLVLLNVACVDGSKIRARASRKCVYDESRIKRERASIERMLEEAEEVDRLEDAEYGSSNGRAVPEELRDVEQRRAKLKKASELLKQSKRERVVSSEPESRVMKTSGGNRPCYNMQAAVDAQSQVIVGMDVVQNEVDHGLLPEIIERVEQTMGMSADVFEADTGYCDEPTLQSLEASGKDVLMPVQDGPKEKRQALFWSKCFLHDESEDVLICPAGRKLFFKRISRHQSGTYKVYAAKGCGSCSFYKQCAGGKCGRTIQRSIVEGMRSKLRASLRSCEGRRLYALRKQTVEPVFGQMKRNMGFDRLLLSGLQGAKAEIALICLAHNLKKCGLRVKKAGLSAASRARNILICLSKQAKPALPGISGEQRIMTTLRLAAVGWF